jgi:hypothetical protein
LLLLGGCAHGGGIPGWPSLTVALRDSPPAGSAYGPQLVVTGVDGAVVHESARLFDTDFVHPKFFRFADRTLMLADFGSEDAYGMIVWSFEAAGVRDLGVLDLALAEERDVFTRGAAATARVEVVDGAYVIRIPGPVLMDPRSDGEVLIARRRETVTVREVDGRLVIVRENPSSACGTFSPLTRGEG